MTATRVKFTTTGWAHVEHGRIDAVTEGVLDELRSYGTVLGPFVESDAKNVRTWAVRFDADGWNARGLAEATKVNIEGYTELLAAFDLLA